MEDQKFSDKRKAPDKNTSSEDLSDVSTVQTPLKRPRMELRDDEIENDPFAFPGDDVIVLPKVEDTTEILFKEPESSSQTLSKIEHISSEENGTKESKEEIEVLEAENDSSNGNVGGNFFKEIIERESSPGPVQSPDSDKIELAEDNNNEEGLSEKQDVASQNKTGKSNSQPTASSSPISEPSTDLVRNPSTEIEIVFRAYEGLTKKTIFEETTIKSDYGRFDIFLKAHNMSLTQSSLSSGYMGDVSSQENSAPPNYRNRNRWTSSTLGSVINRESIKTIMTVSPNDSPTDDGEKNTSRGSLNINKKRGRNEPKMSSTKLTDYSGTATSSSGKLERMKVSPTINGDDTTNGLDTSTSRSSSKSSSDKSKKTSLNLETTANEGSTPNSSRSRSKASGKTASAKNTSVVEEKVVVKKEIRTPASRTASRELSAANSSLLSPASSTALDTPVRIVAKIEGSMAKPTTRFEAEVNNEPVDKDDLSKSSTLWGNIGPGELVYARWRDKNYYSGVVQQKGLNDTWIMDYDDGMTDVASETHIVPIKILGIGTRGVYSPDEGFKPGDAVVLGQKFVEDPEVGSTVKYAIQLEGEKKPIWCTRRQLSIKEVDARNLRQEYQPTPKIMKAAEVSLENIVSGPRRRVAAASNAAKVVGGAFDVSIIGESIPESKSTPKSRSKKGSKRKLSESSTVSDISKTSMADIPGPSSKSFELEEKAHEPEKVVKESPKKSKAKEQSLVFEGYQFFLTASGGGDPASAATGSPTPVVPYDKDEYRELIETQGGKVIDFVGKEKGKDKIFLVSDNFARTVKYIYCLAGSIPCVSHKWVQKCLDENVIVEWKSFELNSGWSLEGKRVIPSHNQKPLKGFKIYITAGSDDLYNYWKPVLTAAQATLLKPKKGKGLLPPQAEVLVTDATCSPEALGDAIEKGIPVVKPEWLVQTIITGKKADFSGDDKYMVEPLLEEEYDGDDSEDDMEEQS